MLQFATALADQLIYRRHLAFCVRSLPNRANGMGNVAEGFYLATTISPRFALQEYSGREGFSSRMSNTNSSLCLHFARCVANRGMPKRYHLKRPDLAVAVTAALAEVKDLSSHRRLLAMRLAASGQFTAEQIAEQIGVSRRQFFHWVNALKAGGVARLLEREHGGGRPARIQGVVLSELLAGLKVGRWKRAKEIQQWLREHHQARLSVKGVYYWLGKLGGVLKVPRKAHAQKDAAASAAFQQTLCAQLKSLRVGGGRPVRVWVADEHRYGLIPVVRRCWTLRGVRPTAPYQTKYQWGYLYSALEVDGQNAAEFACLPGVSLELSRWFLERLAARDPQAEHVVIWDQAGFHPQSHLHALPAHIHLVPLPAYSPELNPVEVIGDLIKDRIANTLWQTLEALEEALGEELRPIYQSAERVRRLVSHPWLIDQVNATAAKNSAVTC
jgi:transposase